MDIQLLLQLHSLMLHTGTDITVLIMMEDGTVPGIIKETGTTPTLMLQLLWLMPLLLMLMDTLMLLLWLMPDTLTPQHISQLLLPHTK
jgi:hypothetical protein